MAEQFNRPTPQSRPIQQAPAPTPKEEGELVTFLPPRGESDVVKWRGVEFKAGVPVRLTDKSHIEAARGHKFFRVGNEAKGDEPSRAPTDAMEYRGHVLEWMRDVSTVDQLARNWAADRDLRVKCEIGHDDIQYLGTLIEPKLRDMRQAEGLSQGQIAEIWMKHGVLELPWRA